MNTPFQSLVVTAARLIYKRFEYNTWVQINMEAFVPAGVIDAWYVGAKLVGEDTDHGVVGKAIASKIMATLTQMS